MNLKSLWQKMIPDGKAFLKKSPPYIFAAVFAVVTVLSLLGVGNTRQEYATIRGTKAELATQKQELETALAQTKTMLEQLNTVNADTQTLLQQAQSKETAVSDKIEQLQDAFDSVENKERQRWILPIQYKVCTSPFGNRDHPIAGEIILHAGVDLAADHGTPIVASRSGTVTLATYEEDNAGYFVIIDHLDGYDSRYMHMDKYIVTEGQFVLAGQVIGYCGNTGAATGHHLHFGIYHNGSAVNPADYIDLY